MAIAIPKGPGEYRAGVCNIGPEEIARRRRTGIVLLLIAIGVALSLVVVDAPAWTRIVVWPPLAAAFTTLEQVRRRFCVAFGLAGVRNLGSDVGHPERVEEPEARAADRRAALIMVTYCALAAAAVTAVLVVVPG